MSNYYSVQFAQTYGSGAYGACAYETSTSCSTSAGGSNTGGSGLVNTGFMVVVIVTLACMVIFAALLVRFWRRRKMATETVSAQTEGRRYRR